MADALGYDFNAILQLSPVVLGMTEGSPEAVLMRLLDELDIKTRFSGYGRVVSQQPTARTPIRRGNTAVLTLKADK